MHMYIYIYIYINSIVFFLVFFLFLSDEGSMLETLDFTINIGLHQPFNILICTYIYISIFKYFAI